MSKFCHRYDANQSLPRSWTKVTCAGVLRRSYWGGSSTPWKVPSNSPLTVGSPQRSTAGGPHLQVDHYEGMAGFLGNFGASCLEYPVGGGCSLNSSLSSRGPTTTISVFTRKPDTNSLTCSSLPKSWPTGPPRLPRFYPNDPPT